MLLLVLTVAGSAHPRGSTADLSELNEYLMALQWLRDDDTQAKELFALWQDVREESWAIRTLTDEEDLEITHPRVVQQIESARARRRELLAGCRRFFSTRRDDIPTAIVHLSDPMTIEWPDPLVETPVGTRRLVLLEVRNDADDPAHVEVVGDPSRQVFTRKASLHLDAGATRHLFAHVAPVEEGPLSGSIRFCAIPRGWRSASDPRRRDAHTGRRATVA